MAGHSDLTVTPFVSGAPICSHLPSHWCVLMRGGPQSVLDTLSYWSLAFLLGTDTMKLQPCANGRNGCNPSDLVPHGLIGKKKK